jgi:transcriptional regulatory protein RtcR
VADVEEEIDRLRESWRGDDEGAPSAAREALGEEAYAEVDRFDRVQLEEVLRVCRTARSVSDAGRVLFDQSRQRRTSVNDADRLRKYLARFGLTFEAVSRPAT